MLKNSFACICLFLFFLIICPCAFAESKVELAELSLEECYDLTLKQSESLQIKEQDVRAVEARYKQVIATIYPQIHLLANQRIRNSKLFGILRNDTNTSFDNQGIPTVSRERSSHPFDSMINVKQPLFTGFREFLIAQATDAEIEATKSLQSRAKELLYLDVADAFYQVLLYERDVEILEKTKKVLHERIAELERFIKLGRARESEILAARSDIADLEATQQKIKGLLSATKEVLAFLTGVPADKLRLKKPSVNSSAGNLEHYLEKSKNRFDLLAAEKQRESFEKRKTAEGRAYLPALSLEGNYYAYEDPDFSRDWELLLRLDVPIFEGGSIRARVEELGANVLASTLAVKELQRMIERDVRIAYEQYESSEKEVKSLKTLLATTKKNYESQRQDYELGVVTNLEVLQTIRQAQDAERRLLDAETNMQTNVSRLKVAAGEI